jgi:two-component system response regulator YesN
MKLIIVDDEPLLRQGIAKIVERLDLPVEVAGLAGDGKEALRLLAEVRPDLVITDIRMPEMDGLDFIGEALQIYPKLPFIIVSGYDDFEYARRGIQYGVVDYLLKPVDHEELRAGIERIRKRAEDDRRRARIGDELALLQRQNEESLREKLLTKLIETGGGDADFLKDEKLAELHSTCREIAVAVFDLALPELPYRSFREGDEALLRFAVSNVITDLIAQTGRRGTLFRHSLYDHQLVYVLGDGEISTELLRRELQEVLDGVNRYLKLEAAVGIGKPAKTLPDLPQSYQQAKLAARERIIHGWNRVYLSSARPDVHASSRSGMTDEEDRLLSRYLTEGNAAAIRQWIGRRIRGIVEREGAGFPSLESFCIELHLRFWKYLIARIDAPEWAIGEIDDLLGWLYRTDHWTEIEDRLGETTDAIIEHLNRLRHSDSYDVMEEVKRYIDANLHEPLSLKWIAERFFLHPNYFSRRFKEKYKESFIGYVTGERIRKASRLLRETELMIQEIAGLVGIPDAAYFSSVFRKATGLTPNQYRAQAAGSPESVAPPPEPTA